MSGRRFRNLLLLAAAAGIVWWLYKDRPTLSAFVDRVTGPLFSSKAAVKESEHKRVEAEAVPVIGDNLDVPVGMLREQMTRSEVRELLGSPDEITEIQRPGKRILTRWVYRRAGRVLDFDDGRLVSIVVR